MFLEKCNMFEKKLLFLTLSPLSVNHTDLSVFVWQLERMRKLPSSTFTAFFILSARVTDRKSASFSGPPRKKERSMRATFGKDMNKRSSSKKITQVQEFGVGG